MKEKDEITQILESERQRLVEARISAFNEGFELGSKLAKDLYGKE